MIATSVAVFSQQFAAMATVQSIATVSQQVEVLQPVQLGSAIGMSMDTVDDEIHHAPPSASQTRVSSMLGVEMLTAHEQVPPLRMGHEREVVMSSATVMREPGWMGTIFSRWQLQSHRQRRSHTSQPDSTAQQQPACIMLTG
jgi:hypothetical protein